MKQLLPCFLSHLWVDCKEAADGADGRAECGKRRTSWRPSRYRYRKSATAAPSVTGVPVALPSSISDFVPGTSPSWSSKVYVSDGRTPYGKTANERRSGSRDHESRILVFTYLPVGRDVGHEPCAVLCSVLFLSSDRTRG